jgi:hypothetical protein
MHANSHYGCDYGGAIYGYSNSSVHIWGPSPFDSIELALLPFPNAFGQTLGFNVDIEWEGDREVVAMTGNGWIGINIGIFEVEIASLLRFSFKATSTCEISAIGLTTNDLATSSYNSEKFLHLNGNDAGEWDFCSTLDGTCTCNGQVRFGDGVVWTNPMDVSVPTACSDSVFPGFTFLTTRHCECLNSASWVAAPTYTGEGDWQVYELKVVDYYELGAVFNHLVLISDCDGTSLQSTTSAIAFSNLYLNDNCGVHTDCRRVSKGHIMNMPRGIMFFRCLSPNSLSSLSTFFPFGPR